MVPYGVSDCHYSLRSSVFQHVDEMNLPMPWAPDVDSFFAVGDVCSTEIIMYRYYLTYFELEFQKMSFTP